MAHILSGKEAFLEKKLSNCYKTLQRPTARIGNILVGSILDVACWEEASEDQKAVGTLDLENR